MTRPRQPRPRVVRPWPPFHVDLRGRHGRVWIDDRLMARIRYRGRA